MLSVAILSIECNLDWAVSMYCTMFYIFWFTLNSLFSLSSIPYSSSLRLQDQYFYVGILAFTVKPNSLKKLTAQLGSHPFGWAGGSPSYKIQNWLPSNTGTMWEMPVKYVIYMLISPAPPSSPSRQRGEEWLGFRQPSICLSLHKDLSSAIPAVKDVYIL